MIRAQQILEELRKWGITHVVGLPDNSSAALFALLNTNQNPHPVSVTREGEAFAIAAGLWMGGKTPVVLIQNTGLLESGDAFRGTVSRMRIPVLCLITYRGYGRMTDYHRSPDLKTPHPDLLSRPDLDSAALVTEPTLHAWGFPFTFMKTDEDTSEISMAMQQAITSSHPVAVLITTGLI